MSLTPGMGIYFFSISHQKTGSGRIQKVLKHLVLLKKGKNRTLTGRYKQGSSGCFELYARALRRGAPQRGVRALTHPTAVGGWSTE
jgi:hypothetical protein